MAVELQAAAAGARWTQGPIVPAPPRVAGDCGDLRFRRLLTDVEWAALTPAIRRRFSRRFGPEETALYVGHIIATRVTRAGRVLGCIARLCGAPLPVEPGAGSAASVAVTENPALRGQIWTRIYARPGRFPQVIHSTKRFSGPTGLEECVGAGVGMGLTVHVEAGALVFRSSAYFIETFGCRLRLPRCLWPGAMTVVHREVDACRFTFALTLDHPLFGRMLEQTAQFSDTAALRSRRSDRVPRACGKLRP
jgi:Domain of unknown function (DUF4166)